MAKLVVFDVDGTLVESVKIDTRCYVQSIEKLYNITNIDTRWHRYDNATDSFIFEEIFKKAYSRKPTVAEILRHVDTFVALLEEHYNRDSNLFNEIPGARNIITRLKTHPVWKVALATGGWRQSTELKLRYAGIDYGGIPFASASDAKTREKIVRKCIDRACMHYNTNGFDTIVSIGDAIWDIQTASNLNTGFVGISKPDTAVNTRGCSSVKDYRDYDTFMNLLETARVPE